MNWVSVSVAHCVLFACLAAAAPAQGRWVLDAKCTKLKPISLKTGVNSWRTWWYVVVTLKNNTGAARPLSLLARAQTETRKRARAVFRPMVRRAIEKKEGRKLANLIALRGTLENGGMVHTVIILADLDKLADRIAIHVTGLSAYLYKDGLKLYKEVREFVVPMIRRGDEFEVHRNPVRKLRPHWVTVSKKQLR